MPLRESREILDFAERNPASVPFSALHNPAFRIACGNVIRRSQSQHIECSRFGKFSLPDHSRTERGAPFAFGSAVHRVGNALSCISGVPCRGSRLHRNMKGLGGKFKFGNLKRSISAGFQKTYPVTGICLAVGETEHILLETFAQTVLIEKTPESLPCPAVGTSFHHPAARIARRNVIRRSQFQRVETLRLFQLYHAAHSPLERSIPFRLRFAVDQQIDGFGCFAVVSRRR